jgi:hypothetical protein
MINLPDEIIPATNVSPNRILMYAKPKQGKSSALSLLPNSLLIDTEAGSNYISARKVCIDITKSIEEQAKEFLEICRAIYLAGYNKETKVYTPKYQTLIIDTTTRLDAWAEIIGTLNYMDKTQGKKWNTIEEGPNKGQRIASTNPNFESVHEMGSGFGYKFSREVMVDWYNKICMLSPRTIFVCHVKDKLVSAGLNGEVMTREIDLTGKVKDIYASKVDTIMYCYREGNKLLASFSDQDGTRCAYLSGKVITLTESNDKGEIITNNWNQIFID